MLLAGAMLLAPARAEAQDPERVPVETADPRIESSIGFDSTNQYFFRGILQENQGVILQPWVDFVFPLWDGETTSWSFNAGTWNSLHNGPTGSGTAGRSIFYELDAYAGIGVDFAENWSSSIRYLALSSPNSAFSTVQELDFSVAFDDSGLFGGGSGGFSGIQPSASVALELDGQSDGGRDKGAYLEVGIQPAFDLDDDEDRSVTVSFPASAGFSLSNYYENAAGRDDFFGFAQGGASFSIPLDFAPSRLGSWSLSGGVSILLLGNNLETINGGHGSEVILSLGLEIDF